MPTINDQLEASPVEWAHPLNAGLLAWWLALPQWRGNTWRDLVGLSGRNAHHCTLSNGPVRIGQGNRQGGYGAVKFDGSDDYGAAVSFDLSVYNQLTVALWLWWDAFANNDAMALEFTGDGGGTSGGWALSPGWSGGGITVYNNRGGLTERSITRPSAAAWHHYVVLLDNSVSGAGAINAIYLDGLAQSPSTQIANSTAGSFANNTLYFMSRAGGSLFGAGRQDDVRLYANRLLTAQEVTQLYTQSRRGHPDTLRRVYGTAYSTPADGLAFDAASNSGYQAAASTYSWSHTCTGSNRFLSVDISLLSASSTVTGITYNGVALSLIGAQSTVTSFGRVECWGLVNPTSGTNTIAVTLSGSIISSGEAVSYTGVHQTVPTESFNSNQATNVGAADATVTITAVADNTWIHATIATSDSSVTANQTTRNNVTGAGGSGADEDFGPLTPAGAKAMSYTGVGALATWAIAGYALRPIAASGAVDTWPAYQRPTYIYEFVEEEIYQ